MSWGTGSGFGPESTGRGNPLSSFPLALGSPALASSGPAPAGSLKDDREVRGSRYRRPERPAPPSEWTQQQKLFSAGGGYWRMFLSCYETSFDIEALIVNYGRQDLESRFCSRGDPLRAAEQILRPSRKAVLWLVITTRARASGWHVVGDRFWVRP